jgi:hypothetical protein
MTFRVLAIPIVVLCIAVLVVLVTVHPAQVAERQAAPVTCAATTGSGVVGLLESSGASRVPAIVQILPAGTYGSAYLDVVRRKLGLPTLGASMSPLQFATLPTVMRYTHTDQHGRFVCRPLDPGKYVAVATSPVPGGTLAVQVATFDVPVQRGLETIANDRFRPLQDIR